MNNALTVDVEDYFHVAAFADNISPSTWDKYQLRVENNTTRLLDLFDQFDTKVTFFTLGWVAERKPELVIEIARRGHEVACHGYSHQLIYKQDQQIFYDETKRAKDILEDITNSKIQGYRAASYSITKQSLWALDVLCDLGFVYDSSIVPVHHDLYGIPDMPRAPHILTAPNGKELIEFPPSTLSLPGMNLPVAGGGYFRLYPYWFSKAALKWINHRDNMPFIFYLHPWEVDPGQPRMQGKWFSRFRHYNNLSKCYSRLEKLLQDFNFTTARNVLVDQKLIGTIHAGHDPAMATS
ncbi:MAG: DUF3473 domain-containing protein [Gammaproteobacteria bacterium]|nr:DUF3473 domain-containing protein [Gammaproteobacteria bacterium]